MHGQTAQHKAHVVPKQLFLCCLVTYPTAQFVRTAEMGWSAPVQQLFPSDCLVCTLAMSAVRLGRVLMLQLVRAFRNTRA